MADAGWNRTEGAYKNIKRDAKAAVAKAKYEAYKEWCDKMGTEEGGRIIYKVAKQRARSRRDIGEVNVIKDQTGDMLTDEANTKDRWREYFNNLLNVENVREQIGEAPAIEGPVREISREEVKNATERMERGKAAGCSVLPIDLIKLLEWSGYDACNTEESL